MPLNQTVARTLLATGTVALAAAAFLWHPATVAAARADNPAAAIPAPNTVEFYTHNVQPILQANCYRCHGGMNHRGGLSLDTMAGMLKGGHDGSVLVPGHPEQSLLIRLIRHEGPADDPMPMPPRSKISDADIATVTAWVQAGAPMPPPPAAK
jgi:cytochrome c